VCEPSREVLVSQVRDQPGKFVSAHPSQGVRFPHPRKHATRYMLQQEISDHVSELIIYGFKAIKVDVKESRRMPFAFGNGEHLK
jgi:hypothetical protein